MLDASRFQRHSRNTGIPADRGAEWVPRVAWLSPEPIEEALAAGTAPDVEGVEAHVNHGRWVVVCPDCSGAQLACRTDPRFMCNECANITVGGLWRPVVWPGNAAEVEAELAKRSRVANRNWVPGESVAVLAAETAANQDAAVSRASEWEGHTHKWPRVINESMVTCDECGLVLPGDVVTEDRARMRGK